MTERYQVWAINPVAPDFHHRAMPIGGPTTLRAAERIAERRNRTAERGKVAQRYVVLHADDVRRACDLNAEPPGTDADLAALIELVDADHRDHGIPDRSVPHDCSDFHYPCPAGYGESLRLITARLDSIDAHISTLIDTVADHIANHGDTP